MERPCTPRPSPRRPPTGRARRLGATNIETNPFGVVYADLDGEGVYASSTSPVRFTWTVTDTTGVTCVDDDLDAVEAWLAGHPGTLSVKAWVHTTGQHHCGACAGSGAGPRGGTRGCRPCGATGRRQGTYRGVRTVIDVPVDVARAWR
jgi:hypothetical protein